MATKKKAHKHTKNKKVSIGGNQHVLSDDGNHIYFCMKWHEIERNDGFEYIKTDNGLRFIDNGNTKIN